MLTSWPSFAALAGVLLLAATSIAVAAPQGEAAEGEKRYRACMQTVATDAHQALADARAWAKAGGGHPARHCAAAADMALGQYGEAAEALQGLAREDGAGMSPNPVLRASLWGQAAHAWLAADRPAQAEAAATEGLRLLPRNADLLVLRARARVEQNRLGDAYLDLDEAIRLNPSLADAYVFRASVLRRQGVLDRAAADLDKALALDPDQPEALLERGILRRLEGDEPGARADWQKLGAVAPRTPAAEAARLNLEKTQKND